MDYKKMFEEADQARKDLLNDIEATPQKGNPPKEGWAYQLDQKTKQFKEADQARQDLYNDITKEPEGWGWKVRELESAKLQLEGEIAKLKTENKLTLEQSYKIFYRRLAELLGMDINKIG